MTQSLLQRSAWSFGESSALSAPVPALAPREAPERDAVEETCSQPHPRVPDELDRVARAARGEPGAQAWLLDQVMPRVRRVTRAFLKSPADADDAAQLALLAILRSASTYRGEASLSAWAKRIAVRTTLRYLEGERRTPSAPAAGDGEELPAPDDARPSEALARDVREYLDELPEAQLAERGELGLGQRHLLEDARGAAQQRAAGVGQTGRVAVSREQLLAQLALEQEHGLAHGRLCFPELIRGLGKAAAAHDGGKGRQPRAV